MDVKAGDKFKVVDPKTGLPLIRTGSNYTGEEIIYTVEEVNGDKVKWNCVGRKNWYKNVRISLIEEHINVFKDMIKL